MVLMLCDQIRITLSQLLLHHRQRQLQNCPLLLLLLFFSRVRERRAALADPDGMPKTCEELRGPAETCEGLRGPARTSEDFREPPRTYEDLRGPARTCGFLKQNLENPRKMNGGFASET